MDFWGLNGQRGANLAATGTAAIRTMRYEDLTPISKEEVRSAVRDGPVEQVSKSLLRMALHEADWPWAESVCLEALEDPRTNIRRAAPTGLGHIARIHRTLHLQRVVPAIAAFLQDPALSGAARDALEDITIFVPRGNS